MLKFYGPMEKRCSETNQFKMTFNASCDALSIFSPSFSALNFPTNNNLVSIIFLILFYIVRVSYFIRHFYFYFIKNSKCETILLTQSFDIRNTSHSIYFFSSDRISATSDFDGGFWWMMMCFDNSSSVGTFCMQANFYIHCYIY